MGMSLRMRMPVGMIPVSVRMGMSVRVIVRMRMIVPVVMVMPIFGMAMIRHRAVFVQHASVRQAQLGEHAGDAQEIGRASCRERV